MKGVRHRASPFKLLSLTLYALCTYNIYVYICTYVYVYYPRIYNCISCRHRLFILPLLLRLTLFSLLLSSCNVLSKRCRHKRKETRMYVWQYFTTHARNTQYSLYRRRRRRLKNRMKASSQRARERERESRTFTPATCFRHGNTWKIVFVWSERKNVWARSWLVDLPEFCIDPRFAVIGFFKFFIPRRINLFLWIIN